MHTTLDLIELAKQRLSIKHKIPLPMTDYRLCKLMNIRQGTMSAWRTGVRSIGPEFSAQFAEVCELPEAYVFACVESEREKNPTVLRILETIAKKFHRAASHSRAAALAVLAILAGLLSAFGPNSSENTAFANSDLLRNNVESVYSVKSRRSRRRTLGNSKTRCKFTKFRDRRRICSRGFALRSVAGHREIKTCALQ